ncbi:MAG: permease-like cell division protein FtsX [Dissulfurispiraceae bacterium]|jgi:cell division transport system permease protein
MASSYSFKSAFKSLAREKWINILSTLTVGSSLLIITLAVFFLYNIGLIADNLPERFSMMAYLQDSLSQEDTRKIMDLLEKKPEVAKLRYISREDALLELKHSLKDSTHLLEGLDDNPLSSSIEIKLRKDFVTPATTARLAGEVGKIPGIDSIYYGERIAEAIHLLKQSVRNISIIIFLTISLGVVFVTYSTVKILFYRKKDEIEILKLLGATGGFIRAPFLIEGGVIGLFGGILGIVGAFVFYFAITYRLSMVIPMLKTLVFPVDILMALPFIGIILGVIGSAIAIGRTRL